MNETTFIREKKITNYTVINNTVLRDDRLSYKAKGLMCYMLSLPDDWVIYKTELVHHAKDGIDSVTSAINELKKFGYLVYKRLRNADGTLGDAQYTIIENPFEKMVSSNKTVESLVNKGVEPKTDFPILDNPIQENPALLNTNNTKYLFKLNTNNTSDNSDEVSYEKVLRYCKEQNFTGCSTSCEAFAEWFWSSINIGEGKLMYKSTKVTNKNLYWLLRQIDSNGKAYKSRTDKSMSRYGISIDEHNDVPATLKAASEIF